MIDEVTKKHIEKLFANKLNDKLNTIELFALVYELQIIFGLSADKVIKYLKQNSIDTSTYETLMRLSSKIVQIL